MISKILIFIFASCVLIGTIQANVTEEFTIDKFTGLWYGIGEISTSIDYTVTYTCFQMNITKQNDHDNSFHDDITVKINGVPKISSGFGVVDKSTIRFYSPNIKIGVETVYSVEMYYDGQEIILRNKNQRDPIAGLFSRTPMVLQTTKAAFEKLIPQGNGRIMYIGTTNC